MAEILLAPRSALVWDDGCGVNFSPVSDFLKQANYWIEL